MKTHFSSALLALCVAALAPSMAACGAEEQEGAGAQFPQTPIGSDDPTGPAPVGPGESPTPFRTVAAAPPPAPQEIVPGSTTEEEYQARPGDVAVGANENEYTDSDPSALTDFRATLDPYGSWVEDPNYGTVWTPSASVVGDDFAPYVSAGRWTYDDAQNYVWVSDYDWGWAPFHYGRWAYLGHRWGWIPGREYAGAWVSWRYGYDGWDYVGWAPLAPSWGWRGGVAFGFGFYPSSPYVFCGSHDVFNPGIGQHLVTGGQVASVGAHTRVFAAPTVGVGAGRVAAHPTVGPAPSSLGLSASEIAHTPLNNRGVMHAVGFARPSTAQGFGAHGAASSFHYSQPAPGRVALGATGYAPSYGRNQPVGQAQQYRGVAPRPYFPSRSLGSTIAPSYGSAPHYGTTYSSGRYASPSYGGGSYGGGSYGGGSYGGGAYHGPVYGGGAYGGGGGYHAPVYGGGGAVYGGGGGYRGGGVVHSGNTSSGGSSSFEDSPGPVIHRGGGGGGGYSRGGGGFRGGGGGGHAGGGHR